MQHGLSIQERRLHAKDELARQWYLHWEFEPSPSDSFHLFLLMKDIKAMVGKARDKSSSCPISSPF